MAQLKEVKKGQSSKQKGSGHEAVGETGWQGDK
jgi:hypothetical protein